MPTEQEWRDKYRDVLSRLAAEEARWSKTQNVLKLLVGRLCLAAQGRDERLDHEIARVADVARKQIDVDALDLLIAPLSAAVAALDNNEASASGARRGPKAIQATSSRNDSTGSAPALSRDSTGSVPAISRDGTSSGPAPSSDGANAAATPSASAASGLAASGASALPATGSAAAAPVAVGGGSDA